MTHERALDRLDDYVSGTLPPGAAADLHRHLEGCDGCRAEEAALRALLSGAAALPREIAPPRDLWAGIAARLEPRAPPAAAPTPLHPRRIRQPPAWLLAAAAVLLMAGTSLVTALVVGGGRGDTVLPVASVQADPPANTAFAAFRPAEREYRRAIDELEALLASHREELAPETVATLETNLAIIDGAIRESRAALAADPMSRDLAGLLSALYDTKVDVLQRAVQL